MGLSEPVPLPARDAPQLAYLPDEGYSLDRGFRWETVRLLGTTEGFASASAVADATSEPPFSRSVSMSPSVSGLPVPFKLP